MLFLINYQPLSLSLSLPTHHQNPERKRVVRCRRPCNLLLPSIDRLMRSWDPVIHKPNNQPTPSLTYEK